MKALHAIALLATLTATLFADDAKRETRDAQMHDILVALKEMSARGEVDLLHESIRDGVLDLGSKFASLDQARARSLIADFLLYLESTNVSVQVAGYKVIYIFNRIYFKVPEWISMSKFRPYGGFSWVPEKEGQLGILFPLRVSKEGELKIEAGADTWYMGAPYQGVAEFDFFSSTYGPRRRAESVKKGPK